LKDCKYASGGSLGGENKYKKGATGVFLSPGVWLPELLGLDAEVWLPELLGLDAEVSVSGLTFISFLSCSMTYKLLFKKNVDIGKIIVINLALDISISIFNLHFC
jgi:hypothetical protein